MHTGMRINAAGWKSIAVSEEMVVGLAPDDAATFANQRLRWGEGNMSVMAYDNPLTMKGLTLAGRINYLASIGCWTMGPARLILYLTPLVMLLTGIAPVADLSLRYVAIVGCYLVSVWTAVKVASNGCGQLIGIETAMMASFHLQLQALWRAIFRRRRQKFVVTKKRRVAAKSLGLRQMWPHAALVAVSIIAVSWAASRVLFGLSEDYFGLLVGSGLAIFYSWLALNVLGRVTAKRDPNGQWRHPLCLAVDYSVGSDKKSAVSVELNENGCELLTWEPLETGQSVSVMFHSPIGRTSCQGRVASSTPLEGRKPFAHLNNIVFEQADPLQRERESDVLRGIILRYIVPVVTMSHRLVRQGTRTLPEQLSGEGDFPIPLTVDPKQPELAVQQSVALSLDKRGFLAVLPVSCLVGSVVQATLNTPRGPVEAEVKVGDVETMRVGTAIVYQHEFNWGDPAAIRRLVPEKKHWKASLNRTASQMRYNRHSTPLTVLTILAGYLIAIATVFAFNQSHRADIMLAKAARQQPATAAQKENIKATVEHLTASSSASADDLLRAYQAAEAIDDDELAAEAASKLADRVESGRFGWLLTAARHHARSNNPQKAATAFDRLLAEPMEPNIVLDEQVALYVEAARAALAVNNLDQAAERFLQASNLKAVDPEQAEEFLGVLISAKKTNLAIQVLRQLERSDRVLRRIVDVYEMANQPEKAVPELEELNRRHPDDAKVVLRLAELAIMRHDVAAGFDYYKTLQKLEPDNENARMKFAETMLLAAREDVAAKRYDNARTMYEESFRLQPPNDAVKREYAGFLATDGRFDQAVAMLEPLTDPQSRIQLAAVLEMQGDNAKALRILLDLETTEAVDENTQRRIARLLLTNRDYEEAAERLAELLKTKPNDPQLQREFVDAVAASIQWSDAVRRTMNDVYLTYQEYDFHSLDAAGFERLGDALRQLDMFNESQHALDRAVAEYPQARRLRFLLAQTLGSLGRYEDAEAQYTILLATRPPRRD